MDNVLFRVKYEIKNLRCLSLLIKKKTLSKVILAY